MHKRFAAELVSFCGINCGACVAFFGYTMRGERRKHVCVGCRTRKSLCAFIKKKCRRLADGEQVDYCFECPDFPCEALETIDDVYKEKYGLSLIENLKFIQRNGVEEFLKAEKEKWKCPTCGGVICIHNKRCYTCNPP